MGDPDIDKVIDYKILSDAAGSSPMWQMIQNLVNHASYHRGQVATMLRQLGAEPGKPTDMFAFYRARTASSS
jgi:uncharacterized damage-inducible protein DinB